MPIGWTAEEAAMYAPMRPRRAFRFIAAPLMLVGTLVASTAVAASTLSGWNVQPSPNVGVVTNHLFGVAATAPARAWAVGYHFIQTTPRQTLIEHWDGTAWTVQPSPNVGSNHNQLFGVTATSETNAWAVGSYGNSTVRPADPEARRTLIE